MSRLRELTSVFVFLSCWLLVTAVYGVVQPDEMRLATDFGSARIAELKSAPIQPVASVRSLQQGWGNFHVGWSVNHRILQLKGQQFQSGFGSHADAVIQYTLPAGATHLTGLCGIDDTDDARQNPHPVAFFVQLDGKEVWHCNPQSSLDAPAHFDIDTTGGKIVTLIAKGGADLTYTPVDFVDLHVTLVDGTQQALGQRSDFAAAQGSGVSFVYDGKPSSEFLYNWKLDQQELPATANYTAQQLTRSDPATGLQCTVTIKQYKHYPVVEWTAIFKNTGDHDTPIIENIRSMDLSFSAVDQLVLHHHTGDYAAQDSYEPHITPLTAGVNLHFAPQGGRPTDRAWPYYNIEDSDEHAGVIAVIGWPGQWSADFVRSSAEPQSLHLLAGQELTHFLLHPGESARTPISVMMFYQGDSVRAQNMWRQWMLAENIPHPYGKLPVYVNASSLGLHQSEQSETDGIKLFTSHGANLNYWWMDAGWYPCTNWWDGVGSWFPDPVRFPHGVKAVSDVAHANGLKLILWIEPERAVPGSDLYKNHPEFLLGKEGGDKLFNLGDPTAWKWMVNRVDDILTGQGIDLYRQDFNEEALGFWRANDATDRQGITEMRHVEGYLAFWDELHRRHPDLLIDTCASGGRRLDLETLRRAVPLWRSDDSNNPEHNQCQTYGLASWVPMFGSGTACDTPYTIRSEMASFFTLGMPSDGKPMDWDLYHREASNWAKIRDNYLGDYYPLLPYSRDMQSWIAWQFDRPDLGTGIVQAFRRPGSPFEVAQFPLRGLDPAASYIVTDLDHPDMPQEITGQQLITAGVEMNLDAGPTAGIVMYVKK